jgi:hypothetical protein
LKTLLITGLALAVGVLAACGGGDTREATPDPLALTTQAANRIRSAQTFRMDVTQIGPDYEIFTDFGAVLFRRATAQYVTPGTMQAAVRVSAAGIPVDVDVYAEGLNQWFRAIWTGNTWVNAAFAPGFDPQTLIAEDTGFQAALGAVIDITYMGIESLETGTQVHHLRGTVAGEAVNALLVGLIGVSGTPQIDLYIETETGYPARITLTETEWADGSQADEPREWTIDITEINAPPELDAPPGSALAGDAEATPEATTESTPDA